MEYPRQEPKDKRELKREEQQSHGNEQNRSKKDGHVSQVGSGQDQQSRRNTGGGANHH